jgi:hypothetical protein
MNKQNQMKTTKRLALALISLFTTFTTSAQNNNVGIGTTTPDASAVLELESTTQGLLPPRMTEAERIAITTPAAGLIVWCTNCGTDGEVQVFNGTAWTNMVGAAAAAAPPPPPVIGDSYGGGIVAYIYQSGDPGYVANETHGLIAATADLSSGIYWTTPSYQSTTVPGGATSTTDGLANSNAIVAQAGAGSTYAAGLCRAYSAPGDGGLNDWYLPSKDELNYLWENLADSDGDNSNTGPTDPNNLGGFAINGYWSSTEYDNFSAWSQNFSTGSQYFYYKLNSTYVRAVRAF